MARPLQLATHWNWLEPILLGVAAGALIRVAALAIRVRVRRPRRVRNVLPWSLRRLIALLGVAVPLSATPVLASGRPSAHPSRVGRPLPEAPWLRAGGFLPPHPLVLSGSDLGTKRSTHPAVHGDGPARIHESLFERAGDRRRRELRLAKSLHPSGTPGHLADGHERRITVAVGDCLWSIAEETLGSGDAARIDRYWRAIFRANLEIIGQDPHRILPGQVLTVPREATG